MILRVFLSLVLVLLALPAVAQNGTVLSPVSISGGMRTFELPSWGNGAPPLLIDIPIALTLTHRQGTDFDVYFVEGTGKAAKSRMGIYVGHTPARLAPKSARLEPAKVGARLVPWRLWSEHQPGKTMYLRETVVSGFFKQAQPASGSPPAKKDTDSGPQGPLYGNLLIHVWVQGTDEDQVKSMAGWAKTIRKR